MKKQRKADQRKKEKPIEEYIIKVIFEAVRDWERYSVPLQTVCPRHWTLKYASFLSVGPLLVEGCPPLALIWGVPFLLHMNQAAFIISKKLQGKEKKFGLLRHNAISTGEFELWLKSQAG